MFRGLGNLLSLLRNASQINQQMEQLSQKLQQLRAQGTAGGEMVRVVCNGNGQVLRCEVDRSLLSEENHELLEDLIVAATNDALEKSRQKALELTQAEMGQMLPQLQQLFSEPLPPQSS